MSEPRVLTTSDEDIMKMPTRQGTAISRFQRQLFLFNQAIKEARDNGLDLELVVDGELGGSITVAGVAKVPL